MSSRPENNSNGVDLSAGNRATTGIKGLDYILGGGFPRNRIYLIEGHPGSGKTTLGLQFLLEGRQRGETGLCISLSENREELQLVADSHGWSLDGIELYELEKLEDQFKPETQYTVFHPGEVELSYTTSQIRRRIEDIRPSRVVFDSLSELRLLAEDPLRFRREMLGVKQFLADRQCTALLLDDVGYQTEPQIRSIVHGVLLLERVPAEYGSSRRRASVIKMRGVKFRDGFHDFSIVTGGLEIYPRLAHERASRPLKNGRFSSGIAELDKLLEGGLDRSTSTVMIGPSGCGKSSLATLYAYRAVEAGERAACYLFEESRDTFLERAAGFGMNLEPYLASGHLVVQQVDPAEMSPGEFSQTVRDAVARHDTSMVVIDSLNGYLNAMPSERYLLMHMHELLTYLATQGVMTILIVAQFGLLGQSMQAPVDITYLADTVIVLRYFEAGGQVKQALSVIKKRRGGHERTIREMRFTSTGIKIGHPLFQFQGILTGVPVFTGSDRQMLSEDRDGTRGE
ncbi:MAG TPA: ATPase domain-containing protein [Bryobacteraceae bacterium]|nr:ATPase domain-containing protein [Bryobacteraceae bacterium]